MALVTTQESGDYIQNSVEKDNRGRCFSSDVMITHIIILISSPILILIANSGYLRITSGLLFDSKIDKLSIFVTKL